MSMSSCGCGTVVQEVCHCCAMVWANAMAWADMVHVMARTYWL